MVNANKIENMIYSETEIINISKLNTEIINTILETYGCNDETILDQSKMSLRDNRIYETACLQRQLLSQGKYETKKAKRYKSDFNRPLDGEYGE